VTTVAGAFLCPERNPAVLKLTDRDAITAALTDLTLDPDIRALIGLRAWQLDDDRTRPLAEIVHFVVVQPGDTPEVINAAAGFPITWELADQPSFEWLEDHGSWFELAYVLTDDLGLLVFVQDAPGVDATLRFLTLGCSDRHDRPKPKKDKA
jgi:hypothetical protein